MGAGLSGVGYLLTQQHPLKPACPLINFDVALMLAPFLLLGVGIGMLLPELSRVYLPNVTLLQYTLQSSRCGAVDGSKKAREDITTC